jgi:hypothetical protein
MDIKAELLKIKSYLMSSDVTTEPTEEVGETPVVEHNFAEYETATGVKVKIDGEIAVGVPVVAVAEDGTEAPAPDGEHEIVGVAKIVVKDGLIAEIMPLEEEPKVEVEVELAEEMPIVDITAELQDRIVALEGKLDELMKKFEGMTKATEAMTAVVEEISTLPTAEVSKPASFTYLYPKSKQDKNIEKFLQALK